MSLNKEALLYILSIAIRGEKIKTDKVKNIIWEEILEQAKEQNVYSIIYPAIKDLDCNHRPCDDIFNEWKKQTIFAGIAQQRNINKMEVVLKAFNKEKLPVIALKGLVLREYYPQKELRTMSDVDILIHERDLDKAKAVLFEMGYSEGETDSKHIVFFQKGYLPIELHWELIDTVHFKNAEYLENDIWKRTNNVKIGDGEVLTPSIENQVVYLCLHMATHFVYSGFGLRQLCDLVLFIESNENSIDWNLVYEKAKKCKVDKFTLAILEICKRFFKLNIPEEFKNKDLVNIKYLDMIEESIISKGSFEGIYGKMSFEFGPVSQEMLEYSEKNEQTRTDVGKILNLFKFLFPSLEKMKYRYEYVNRCSIFLPVAWIHRILHGIIRNDISMSEKSDLLLSDSKILKERAELFKWLDL